MRNFLTESVTTVGATPLQLSSHVSTIGIGEALWIHARVKAGSSADGLYTEVMFYARRPTAAALVIYSKELERAEFGSPAPPLKWKVDMVAVNANDVTIVVIGAAGVTIDWAVSSRGYKKHA
jgi:hypothetical protein